ncbi:Hypothetical protein FKW44_009353 [Caligus rogercresseyi]|uniref:Uncharacterized protein n=1 Tax=Caligus rogercresseyi TaxID=217165 RepID=A0A7T8HF55_CALRO|nr:Hypothetical protein FKW44_009353 [Caligus rogercresseyi]
MGFGFAEHTQGVLGLQTHRQWALGSAETRRVFGVTNSPPMRPRVPPNLIGVFWGYISPANGPLGSDKPNRGVLGYKSPPMGPRVLSNTIIYFRVTNPLPMGPRVLPNTLGVFWGYKSPANDPLDSAEHTRDVLGLQIPRQWASRSA